MMDNTNPNTAQTPTSSQGQQPVAPGQVVIGGAFGGTFPAPSESISQTMPSFSFDEGEYGEPVLPSANSPVTQSQAELDPFAGGIASTQFS